MIGVEDQTHLAQAERADLAELLRTLTPAQWACPTLCEGWDVREVVAHLLSYEELDVVAIARRLGQARFSLDRANAIGVTEYDRSPDELIGLLERNTTPRGLTARLGGRIALVDSVVHHQDIRRPLGLPRTIPPDRLRATLDMARVALPLGGPWRTRGLRAVADDIAWAAGRGPEVRGPGESLLMAIAGRRGAIDELSGPGCAILAGRVGVS